MIVRQPFLRNFYRNHRRLHWRLGVIAAGGAAMVLFTVCCYFFVERYDSLIYQEIDDVPAYPVALVLGTSRNAGGGLNRYFRYRLEAAARLYHAGKVKKLLVSGDNGRRNYDEPTDMRDYLITLGVPQEAIHRDFAGFRTFDSVVRADKVFQQQKFIIISQRYHCNRALYLARSRGLDAIGFEAKDLGGKWKVKSTIRELGARVLAVAEANWPFRRPKYYGPLEDLEQPDRYVQPASKP